MGVAAFPACEEAEGAGAGMLELLLVVEFPRSAMNHTAANKATANRAI